MAVLRDIDNVSERRRARRTARDDTHWEEDWAVKERIRRSDGVLKQAWRCFESEYRRQAVSLLLAETDGDAVLAFAVIHPDGYLPLFGVVPERRRRGLGTQLIETILDDYPLVACHTRVTNRSAVEFYEHGGFTVERRLENHYQNGTDARHLRLEPDRTD